MSYKAVFLQEISSLFWSANFIFAIFQNTYSFSISDFIMGYLPVSTFISHICLDNMVLLEYFLLTERSLWLYHHVFHFDSQTPMYIRSSMLLLSLLGELLNKRKKKKNLFLCVNRVSWMLIFEFFFFYIYQILPKNDRKYFQWFC